MYKKSFNFLLMGLALVTTYVFSASNQTVLKNKKTHQSEAYSITLRAPDVVRNTFYVPVEYYRALQTKTPLKATLEIPLKLKITSSRKRRLLVMYTHAGEAELPYGNELDTVTLFQIGNTDDNEGETVLTNYKGPRNDIVRTIEDGTNNTIDFKLSLTHEHFHNGYLQIVIGATNGEHLTEICEIANTNCLKPLRIRIKPRYINYSLSTKDQSELPKVEPTTVLRIDKSSVPLNVISSGENIGESEAFKSSRHKIEYMRKHGNSDSGAYTAKFELQTIYQYMSSDAYAKDDRVMWSNNAYRPDLLEKNDDCVLSIRSNIALGYDNISFNGEDIGYTPQKVNVKKGSQHDVVITITKDNQKAQVGEVKSGKATCQGDFTEFRLDWEAVQ